MRKLMWFVIGFAAMSAISAYLLHGQGLLIAFLCTLLAFILHILSKEKHLKLKLVLIGAAAALLWCFLFGNFYLKTVEKVDDTKDNVTVRVSDFSEATKHGTSVDGRVELEGKTYRIRLYSYEDISFVPGDTVYGEIELHYIAGDLDSDTYLSGEGVYLVGYLGEHTVNHAERMNLRQYPVYLREWILHRMNELFPEDTMPFAQALMLGQRSELDYETNTALSVSGIRHVVAVSGLHVSILCSLVILIFGYHRVITPIVGVSLLVIFAAVTGFTPSVVRSCLMYTLMFGALAAQKEYDAPTSLAFAVLVMLLINPLSIMSVSLQLSVLCVVGILLFSEKIQKLILSEKCLGKASSKSLSGKLKRWFAASVSVTLSTMITTTPLCAIYFGTISLVGVLTNLLTLWMITIVFCGVLAGVVLGTVYVPIGKAICWLLSWGIRYVLFVSKSLAALPFAAVYTQSPYIVAWIIFSYLLIAAFAVGQKKHFWLTLTCVVTSLILSVSFSWLEPHLEDYRFTVLDVGQGQCILVQSNDRYYMIDCGGDSPVSTANLAAQTLLSQGITNLDGVILTHYDTDHAGGLENFLTRIPAETLYLPNYTDDTLLAGTLSESAENVCWISSGETVQIAQGEMTIFAGSEHMSDNESSLCVLFQPENCAILICSDRGVAGERDLLENAQLPQVDVLVVGHHGAKDSSGLELLHTVQPKTAIISVGADNPYGHPSDDVLMRLELFSCNILRTDQNGTIMIRG